MGGRSLLLLCLIIGFTSVLCAPRVPSHSAGKRLHGHVGGRGSVEHKLQHEAHNKPPTKPVHQNKPYYNPEPGKYDKKEMLIAYEKFLKEREHINVKPEIQQSVQHRTYDPVPWRICFYTNWAQYRPEPYTFFPEDIDGNLCSHLFFAFSDLDEDDHTLKEYETNDEEMYVRFNQLKVTYPNLKTVLAVGGWTFGTAKMTRMMSSQANRTMFITSAIERARFFGFDGIDLDFEYPAHRGSPEIDRAQLTCLCQEMRQAFDAESPSNTLTLSTGIAGYIQKIDRGYNILGVAAAVDKINVMSYDYFGIWDGIANSHSPLFMRQDQSAEHRLKNVKDTVDHLIEVGCPRHKLNLGVPVYGRGYRLANTLLTQPGAATLGGSTPGTYTKAEGIKSYYELCMDKNLGTVTEAISEEERTPYMYYADQWFGLEEAWSLQEKVDYLREERLGGYMAWALDYDDFNGQSCGQGPYPLFTALSNQISGYVVPEDTSIESPDPIPPPSNDFCNGKANGLYLDLYSCARRYTCSNGATQIDVCAPLTTYIPTDLSECQSIANFDAAELCLLCPEQCDCDTLITPLNINTDKEESRHAEKVHDQ